MNIDHGKREWTLDEIEGVREAVDEAATKAGLSRAEVARRSQVAASTLSQFMSGNYGGDNVAVATQLARWLDAHNRQVEFLMVAPPEPTFVQTRTASKVIATLQHAQLLQDTGVVVGPPGIGKTASLEQYAAKTPRVYRVTASPAVSTPHAVLAQFMQLYTAYDCRTERALVARTGAVRRTLDKGALMVIDEAQHLSMAAVEELRAIHDDRGCGLVLMGNPYVLSRLQGGQRDPAYAQIFGRIGARLVLTKKDVAADVPLVLATMGIDASEVVAEAVKIAGREDVRVVVKVARSAMLIANGARENLEPKHLRAAYRALAGDERAA